MSYITVIEDYSNVTSRRLFVVFIVIARKRKKRKKRKRRLTKHNK